MSSHMQIGSVGIGGTSSINRIFNHTYTDNNNNNNKYTSNNKSSNETTGGGGGGADGGGGSNNNNGGSLAANSSSLDYLYQAISLIEQKNTNNNNLSSNNNNNRSSSYHHHTSNSNNSNNNKTRLIRNNLFYHHQQQPQQHQFHSQHHHLLHGENFNSNIQQYQLMNNNCSSCSCNSYQKLHLTPSKPSLNTSSFSKFQRKTTPITLAVNDQITKANNYISINQNTHNNISNKATPSRLEKAKQLARNQLLQSPPLQTSSAAPIITYLPPSPISSTCSTSNLSSSLSSSVSVSPSSSSSPSTSFNANNFSSIDATQNMLLSNLLPFYFYNNNNNTNNPNQYYGHNNNNNINNTNNDYLKNLISTVYALTNYQQQQQQQQYQYLPQYNEQSNLLMQCPSSLSTILRNSNNSNNNTLIPSTPKPISVQCETNKKSTTLDVNAKVDEHFKRSLGTHHFNSIFNNNHINKKSLNILNTKNSGKILKKSLLKPKSVTGMINKQKLNNKKFTLHPRPRQIIQTPATTIISTPPTPPICSCPEDELSNETASLNASLVKQEQDLSLPDNLDDEEEEEGGRVNDDLHESISLSPVSSLSLSPSSVTAASPNLLSRIKSQNFNNELGNIKIKPNGSKPNLIVDKHFSKALGIDTWNKLKTSWPLSASSPLQTSSTNFSSKFSISTTSSSSTSLLNNSNLTLNDGKELDEDGLDEQLEEEEEDEERIAEDSSELEPIITDSLTAPAACES